MPVTAPSPAWDARAHAPSRAGWRPPRGSWPGSDCPVIQADSLPCGRGPRPGLTGLLAETRALIPAPWAGLTPHLPPPAPVLPCARTRPPPRPAPSAPTFPSLPSDRRRARPPSGPAEHLPPPPLPHARSCRRPLRSLCVLGTGPPAAVLRVPSVGPAPRGVPGPTWARAFSTAGALGRVCKVRALGGVSL